MKIVSKEPALISEPRPISVEDQHLTYLDNLRVSGDTNMFGAAPYLEETFGVTKKDSREILAYWMKSFSERHPHD